MIIKCGCAHEAQDRIHGSGKRVHNQCPGTPPKYRCTVCQTTKDAPKGVVNIPTYKE